MSAKGIGMMSDAYFVGKRVIINWVNELLVMNITKIEDCGSGAIAAQILDALYPGTVSLRKVKFDARAVHEYTENWKVVQEVFHKKNIDKVLDIVTLAKGKYMANLEFCQWLFEFFKQESGTDDGLVEYDAERRRAKSKGGKTAFKGKGRVGGARKPAAGRAAPAARRPARTRAAASTKPASRRPKPRSGGDGGDSGASSAELNRLNSELDAANAEVSELTAQQESKQAEIDELTNVAKDLEKERDFYFNKILELEGVCKDERGPEGSDPPAHDAFIERILEVLYATDDGDDEEGAG